MAARAVGPSVSGAGCESGVAADERGVEVRTFGTLPDGRKARLFTLRNRQGTLVRITNYGTIVTELHVPDRRGRLTDVVLGFDRLEPYLQGHPYFGCTVGRVANRIAGARFVLDGQTHQLPANDGTNCLHGGPNGFDKALWQARVVGPASIRFRHVSPDGDQGFPGRLVVTLTVSLTPENELWFDYQARTDRPTPVNLSHHGYFNLAGEGTIHRHRLQIAADFYTPKGPDNVPTGEIRLVAGTPMDFRKMTCIGTRLTDAGENPPGYDHNFVLRGDGEGWCHTEVSRGRPGRPAFCARVEEPRSGRFMEVWTTEPGVQFYTGNWLDGSLVGKGGWRYERHAGLCLETQHFPNAVNIPHFPSVILRPGQVYRQTTFYRFGTL